MQINNRRTGTVFYVELAKDTDWDVGAKWCVTCEAHSTLLGTHTKENALSAARHPDWCADCQEYLERTGR